MAVKGGGYRVVVKRGRSRGGSQGGEVKGWQSRGEVTGWWSRGGGQGVVVKGTPSSVRGQHPCRGQGLKVKGTSSSVGGQPPCEGTGGPAPRNIYLGVLDIVGDDKSEDKHDNRQSIPRINAI